MKRPAWGKIDDETGDYHPLAHHSMDVAAVFLRMLQLPVIRDRLNTAAATSLSSLTCERLAALVFLHDIGKLHPGFQAKGWPPGLWRGPLRGHVGQGCAFLELACRWPHHPFHPVMRQILEWGDAAAASLLDAILAHHGRPVAEPADPTLGSWNDKVPHYNWREEASVMNDALRGWFTDAFVSHNEKLNDEPRFHHMVAGLVALADWIASDRQFFQYSAPFDRSYDKIAHRRANHALSAIGFDPGELPSRVAPTFLQIAGHATPRPAQAAVGAVAPDARLMVLEAETGSGKTEAALWRFTQLLAAGAVSSLYFAVPTRAAARQLHRRIDKALRRAYGANAPEAVLAIPGMVRAGDASGRKLPDWSVLWEDHSGPVSTRWAAEHATRFLAAPVAVGTVDQAMLAALQVKHAHLRGSAMSRSLLVIDEVHASDAYMSAVIDLLLHAHLGVGGYAMLMSATLGARARTRWIDDRLPAFEASIAVPYPAVWIRGESQPRIAAADGDDKTVHLETIPTMDPMHAAKRAVAEAQRGARVLVVRNTVRVAVATWHAVHEVGGESLLMRAADGSALHHGRYAVEDRALLDRAVERALAVDRQRALGGCIVIGTQTLEQSLDIDADLMITDLCPMDVLLQRIGRVHRHDLPRPDGFEDARVVVLLPSGGLDLLAAPAFENGLGTWDGPGGRGGIYQELAVLELTRRLVDEHTVWQIPAMNRALVEGATHPERVAAVIGEMGEAWKRYHDTFGGAQAAEAQIADMSALDRSVRFEELQFPSKDERIMTRLGAEGVVIQLNPARKGPFGVPVTRITLPPRWSFGISSDPEIRVEHDETGLLLLVDGRSFRYDRTGLDRIQVKAT